MEWPPACPAFMSKHTYTRNQPASYLVYIVTCPPTHSLTDERKDRQTDRLPDKKTGSENDIQTDTK